MQKAPQFSGLRFNQNTNSERPSNAGDQPERIERGLGQSRFAPRPAIPAFNFPRSIAQITLPSEIRREADSTVGSFLDQLLHQTPEAPGVVPSAMLGLRHADPLPHPSLNQSINLADRSRQEIFGRPQELEPLPLALDHAQSLDDDQQLHDTPPLDVSEQTLDPAQPSQFPEGDDSVMESVDTDLQQVTVSDPTKGGHSIMESVETAEDDETAISERFDHASTFSNSTEDSVKRNHDDGQPFLHRQGSDSSLTHLMAAGDHEMTVSGQFDRAATDFQTPAGDDAQMGEEASEESTHAQALQDLRDAAAIPVPGADADDADLKE